MSIDTLQKRMSAMNPMSPWRGVLVDATEPGFNADNRAAADYAYSGEFQGPPISGIDDYGPFFASCGKMMMRR